MSVGRVREVSAAAALIAVLVLAAVPFSASAAPLTVTRDRVPWLLTSLPSIGSITWRCRASSPMSPRAYALGFKAFASSATDQVTFSAAGRARVRRTVQPVQSVAFPYLAVARQRVEVVQGTEPRTLYTTVTVNFQARAASSYCWSYLPAAHGAGRIHQAVADESPL